MDNTTQPQQLDLSFGAPAETVPLPASPSVSEMLMASVAVVYDFKSAAAKREASTQANLYRQILDSVRHIG
jgi:hypothetical protein